MAKYDFAKYFANAYQNRLARDQQAEELKKKLGMEQRRLSLLDAYRNATEKRLNATLEETIRHNKATETNQSIIAEAKSKGVKSYNDSVVTDDKGNAFRIDLRDPNSTPTPIGIDTKTPDFSKNVEDLNNAWSEYSLLKDGGEFVGKGDFSGDKGAFKESDDGEEVFRIMNPKGDIQQFTRPELEKYKKFVFDKVIKETDSFARAMDKESPGFEKAYNQLLRIKDPVKVDKAVEELMGSQFTDTEKRRMRELIKKRIF